MNKRSFSIFHLFLISGTIFLTVSFYNNRWNVVEPSYYRLWERTYERVVIARLGTSSQNGFFASGGLLGLANAPEGWTFDPDRQYRIYESGEKIDQYLAYKSHPGFQGLVFGVLDFITPFTPSQNIVMIRLITAFITALVLALFSAWIAVEFGWLGATIVLLFSAFSEWMILPAMNSYWSLWAFYLPFITGIFVLENMAKNGNYYSRKIYTLIFISGLIKILFTGFEIITTAWVMVTVPFVYHAVMHKWDWKTLLQRLVKVGLVLSLVTVIGLGILILQVSINDGSISNAIVYISDTFTRRATGNLAGFIEGPYGEAFQANAFKVIKIYLNTNAFNTQTSPYLWQVPYWMLILLFIICTIVLFIKSKNQSHAPTKETALIVATWYSMIAPLSWYILFTPTSYIHTFLFPMAWQMPFVLMGFALCGYVIQAMLSR